MSSETLSTVLQAREMIENFDRQDIRFGVLYTHGRGGTMLTHSLLDSHPEIILIPRFYTYYNQYDTFLKSTTSLTEMVNVFMTKTGFNFREPSLDYLGPDKNEPLSFDSKLDEFKIILLDILELLKIVNRKTFILAVNYAYAILNNRDFSTIRCFIVHHHHAVTTYHEHPTNTAPLFDAAVLELVLDFPDVKIMHCIRNPYDIYYRSLVEYQTDKHLKLFYRTQFFLLMGFYQAAYLSQALGPSRYRFIRLEDVHIQHEETMASLCTYLGISPNASLSECTVEGKIWWGVYPQTKPVTGTNPQFKQNTWVDQMNDGTLAQCNVLIRPVVAFYGYTIAEKAAKNPNIILNWNYFERTAYLDFWRQFLVDPLPRLKSFLPWLIQYPFERLKLLREFQKIAQLPRTFNVNDDFQHIPFFLKKNLEWLRTLQPY